MNYRIKEESIQAFLNENSTYKADRSRGENQSTTKEIFISKTSPFGIKLKESDTVIFELTGEVRAFTSIQMDASMEHKYLVFDHDDFAWKLKLDNIKADVKEIDKK